MEDSNERPVDVGTPPGSDDTEAGGDAKLPEAAAMTKKRKRCSRRGANNRGYQRPSIYYGMLTYGHRVWGHLVDRVEKETWATLYKRRATLLCLDLDSSKHRGIEELEAGTILCRANALTIAHAPRPRVEAGAPNYPTAPHHPAPPITVPPPPSPPRPPSLSRPECWTEC